MSPVAMNRPRDKNLFLHKFKRGDHNDRPENIKSVAFNAK